MCKQKKLNDVSFNVKKATRKLCFVFIGLFAVFSMEATAMAQNELIDLKLNNATVLEAVKAVEKQTAYKFVYSNADVDVSRKVSVNVVKANIEAVAKTIFGGYDIAVKGNNVVVTTRKTANNDVRATQQSSQRNVTGQVVDAKTDETIIGANIWIKESSRGTVTDMDGNFSIPVSGNATVLVISYLGYDNLNVEVGNRTNLGVIKLSPSSQALDEVVVVGYGTQKKESVIGAISTVSVNELKVPSSKISNILAGRLAGIVSVTRSGEPGTGSDFYIRGISTFGANKNPLVIVDGIERSLDLVDSEDIESFSVLKDATATAVYGVRGANGVVIITTRKGVEGKPRINFRMEQSMTGPTQLPKLVNAAQFAELYNEASGTNYYTPEVIQKYLDGSDPDLYPNVNWMKSLYNDFAHSSKYNMNISGGGSVARYYIAGSLYDEGSIFKQEQSNSYNSSLRYRKVNFRANVDINVTTSTVLSVNLANIYENRRRPGDDMGNIWTYTFSTAPNAFPMRYSDGRFSGPLWGSGSNPYNLLMQSGYANDYWNNAQALVGLSQDLAAITPGLKANVKFSWDARNSGTIKRGIVVQQWLATGRNEKGELEYNETARGDAALGYDKSLNGNRVNYLEASMNYDRLFAEKHRVGALVLYNQKQRNELAAGDGLGSLPYRNQGVAARVTYAYADKYFTEFNMGYNGSENFARGHRFGFFPAGAVGYMVSNEDFWQPISNTIDVLKLKASYGLVGNDQIGGSRRFIYEETVISEGNNYKFGETGGYGPGRIRMGEPSNPFVSWEKAYKFNTGIELSLYRSLRLQFDYFNEKREGIFMVRAGLAGLVGLSTTPWVNVGKVNNHGFDATMEFNRKIGKVDLTARGNFTFAQNTLVDNDEPDWNYKYRNKIGKSLNQPFGLVSLGLFESQEEINNSPAQSYGPVRPGDIKYLDVNGDGVVDTSDEIAIGYPDMPQVIYGFSTTANWKGFDVSVFFQGVARTSLFVNGASIYGFTQGSLSRASVNEDVYNNRWTVENPNPNAKYPRMSASNNENNNRQSTFRMHDASFLRLKTTEIGYTLPRKFTEQFYVNALRVYLSGNNLLAFSKFKLWDPERGGGQGAAYPPNRVVTVGLNVNF